MLQHVEVLHSFLTSAVDCCLGPGDFLEFFFAPTSTSSPPVTSSPSTTHVFRCLLTSARFYAHLPSRVPKHSPSLTSLKTLQGHVLLAVSNRVLHKHAASSRAARASTPPLPSSIPDFKNSRLRHPSLQGQDPILQSCSQNGLSVLRLLLHSSPRVLIGCTCT